MGCRARELCKIAWYDETQQKGAQFTSRQTAATSPLLLRCMHHSGSCEQHGALSDTASCTFHTPDLGISHVLIGCSLVARHGTYGRCM